MDSSTTVSHDHLKQYMVNFNPMDYWYTVKWQSDLVHVYAIECVLPVCDKPFHLNNGFQQMWAENKKCETMHCIRDLNLC